MSDRMTGVGYDARTDEYVGSVKQQGSLNDLLRGTIPQGSLSPGSRIADQLTNNLVNRAFPFASITLEENQKAYEHVMSQLEESYRERDMVNNRISDLELTRDALGNMVSYLDTNINGPKQTSRY